MRDTQQLLLELRDTLQRLEACSNRLRQLESEHWKLTCDSIQESRYISYLDSDDRFERINRIRLERLEVSRLDTHRKQLEEVLIRAEWRE